MAGPLLLLLALNVGLVIVGRVMKRVKYAMGSISRSTFDWVCTKDDKKRACTLYVVTRSLGGLIKHVGLYFDWGDKQAIYDAGKLNYLLVPSWSPETLDESEYTWVKEETYECTCSPRQVNRAAVDLERTGKPYDLKDNNCYWWAYDLAKALDVTIKYSRWAVLRSFLPF